MKRKLLTLMLALSMLAMIAWTPQPAFCFGCTAEQKKECFDESERRLQECVDLYGEAMGNWCNDEANKWEATCLLVKGCPIPLRLQ